MSALFDELHNLAQDLEDEGHSLAGRLRDLVGNLRDEFHHLLTGGKTELEAFVETLVATIVPELHEVRDDIVTAVLAEVRKVTVEAHVAVSDVEGRVVDALHKDISTARPDRG